MKFLQDFLSCEEFGVLVLCFCFCCHCHFFWDISNLSSQLLCSFISISSPPLNSSGSPSRMSQPMAVASAPLVGDFSHNYICVQFQFLFQHYHVSILCSTFATDSQFLLSMIHFVKYHVGLSLGDKETMCFAVCT